ncbi:unnamed protein product [Linum tenue]|uniref:Peptidase A1 domain-containing protein n=1 Tax=Linum tenue TaxID=586396 RepID=A0AAV0P7L2_9ROSI|nr:unnamed protein product [Linum tenue]
MAVTFPSALLLISCLLCFCITLSQAQQPSFRPKALVLPVTKHPSTLQYLTHIIQRTPQVPVKLALDLGGRSLWIDCEDNYASSSYAPSRCESSQCHLANSNLCTTECYQSSPKPGCYNNTCGMLLENTFTQTGTTGDLGQDLVSIQSTDGSNPGKIVKVPHFLFTCALSFVLDGLAKGVKGIAGLGRSNLSLPSQFSAAFSFPRKFAICLSKSGKGAVFFGDGPYVMQPKVEISKSLIYTPLLLKKVSTEFATFAGEPSSDYFIGVKSIKINNKTVPLNTTLLKINKEGFGGTKISTVQPYTVLETSIYKAVIATFAKALSGVARVAGVRPFELCYNSAAIGSTRVGPAVPQIDLVLQSSKVYWRIFGANSMVQVKKGVLCLGFVDGGMDARAAIVIGGHQLEDNLLQFDLAASRVGFSLSLLSRQTTCANFNFTSAA